MCEYIVGRRIPRARVRLPTPSPPDSPTPPPAPKSVAPKPKATSAPYLCSKHRPRSRSRSRSKSPRRKVTVHVTDYDTSSDESSSGESIKVVHKELKSALKKPAKEELPKKTVPEVCKTTKREARECECAYCLKGLLDEVKIDIEKRQEQKKHVSFDNRCRLPFFSCRAHRAHPLSDLDLRH